MVKRAYTSTKFCFELQSQAAGWLHTAEGGQASTDIVEERQAGGYPARKHPGTVKFDDITIACGAGMSKQFYAWLQSSIRYEHERKEGAIVTADYDYKEVNRLNFYQGLITEIGFPALDATSRESCKITVKIAPERTEMVFGNGTQAIIPSPIDAKKQKQWHAANFRLRIHGMEESCKRVSKVEALTIKQKVIENSVGERLYFEKEPVQIDFPNLVITIPEADARPWYDWHHEFVIKGQSDQSKEKQGTLEYLTPDLKPQLFTLSFGQLGIVKFNPDKMDSGASGVRMVKIEMYCETIGFEYHSGSTWT